MSGSIGIGPPMVMALMASCAASSTMLPICTAWAGAMKDQGAVVRQQDCATPRRDSGADIGDRLGRATWSVAGDRDTVRQAEHRQRLDPALDTAAGHRKGRRIWRVRVDNATRLGLIGVNSRVHVDDSLVDRRDLA